MANFRGRCLLVFSIAIMNLFISACTGNKLTQCQRIYLIAENTAKSNKSANYASDKQPIELKSWLQAAAKFEQAADNIRTLKIERPKLVAYQNQLATLYDLYARATYDAVQARENKDLSALNSAREDATKAELVQQELIKKINAYCLPVHAN